MELLIRYWETVEDKPFPHNNFEAKPKTPGDRLEGLAFSFLSMLDGACMDVPAFTLYPDPHPEDKQFHKDEGSNWWPEEKDGVTVHGGDWPQLHEYFHEFGRRHGYLKDGIEPKVTK